VTFSAPTVRSPWTNGCKATGGINAWERHATTVAPVWGVTTLPKSKAGNANSKIDRNVPWTENHHHAQGLSYHHSFTSIAVWWISTVMMLVPNFHVWTRQKAGLPISFKESNPFLFTLKIVGCDQ
jgi:hypothetical protein